MLKRTICTVILISMLSDAFSQDSLKNFNYSRNQVTVTGMEVLGSWAIANIAVGSAGWANSNGGSNKYFYQMEVIWNVSNLGAAVIGYTRAQKNKNRQLTAAESLKEQKKIETTFLVNGGIDLAYIGAGLYLKHRGDIKNSDKLRGNGSSVIVQGVFLLLFDGTMYNAERHNGNKLRRFLERNPITFNGKSAGIIFNM